MRGNIVLNGVPIEPSKLTDRVAYVKTDHHFTPDMSVRQTMLFHAFLREPGSHSRARDTKGMKYISLIEKKIDTLASSSDRPNLSNCLIY